MDGWIEEPTFCKVIKKMEKCRTAELTGLEVLKPAVVQSSEDAGAAETQGRMSLAAVSLPPWPGASAHLHLVPYTPPCSPDVRHGHFELENDCRIQPNTSHDLSLL